MASPTGFTVFMSPVPAGMTQESLGTQLSPILKKLNIEVWDCSKPRQKKFALVTFLYRKDGLLFLREHGQKPIPGAPSPRVMPNLRILGQPVHCRESDKSVDPVIVKVLLKAAEDRKRPQEEIEQPSSDIPAITLKISGISCGHYDYPGGKLNFVEDIQWTAHDAVAKFSRDTLVVTFTSNLTFERLEFSYRTIQEVVVSDRPSSLLLTLWEPPRMFEHPDLPNLETLTVQMLYSSQSSTNHTPPKKRVTRIRHDKLDHGAIIGQSLIYCITLEQELVVSHLARLRRIEHLNFTNYCVPVSSSLNCPMLDGWRVFKSTLENLSPIIPFDILYQFQALVQNGYLLPRTAEKLLRRLFENASRTTPANADNSETAIRCPISAEALKKLFSQMPFAGPYTEAKMFDEDEIWSLLKDNEKKFREGLYERLFSERARQNLTMVYKVQVTPSRIILTGPEPEAKNRILRKYPRHTDYFTRVQFCDEDGQDLYYSPKFSLDGVYEKFNKVLLDGFQIAGRLYKFLGFSHSSLRSHAVWYMAGFVDGSGKLRSYITVIKELGNFQGIRSPARCAARIGQAFSETPNAVDLVALNVKVERIPDVKSPDGRRVFSDGVGIISRELMEAIHDAMPQKSRTATCFQIRWAGAKGMLSLDDTLHGKLMRVRDSMIKFESDDTKYLEICDVANKPIPLVLNRQMIKILEDMGIPAEWFIQAQNRELDRLRRITMSTQNTVTFLKRQNIAEQIPLHKFLRRLDKLGFDYKKDRFLCSVVEAVVLREVRLLKHKSRIPIEQGVTLFGIMDEFGYLAEDEVYIVFDEDSAHPYPELHNRLVILTRSPALHPGDIQIRKTVVPPLHHPLRSLSNCIVFSQKGDRDLPSQLSGGDLDGDIYNVIWDPDAVRGCRYEFEPADYPRVEPLNIGRDVEARDMTGFFVGFMATDRLGYIATRHLILSDYHIAGTVHQDCKTLAEMHSTAVDYSKTGIAVGMDKMSKLTRMNGRPEFLAPAPPANIVDRTQICFEPPITPSSQEDEDDDSGPKHKFYKSEKVLGTLYRAIDEKRIWRDNIHLTVDRSGTSLWDEVFAYIEDECRRLGQVKWRDALEEAWSIRQAYEDMIWSATIDFSDHASKAITELEVFTGSIFNKTGIQTRRQRDTSTRLKDEFDRITKWVASLMRRQESGSSLNQDGELQEESVSDDPHEENIGMQAKSTALELSVACLAVGLGRASNPSAKLRNPGEFESFRIIAAHNAFRELDMRTRRRDSAIGGL